MKSIQKTDPVYRHGDGPECFFHFAFQDIGPRCVQHVAVLIIRFREKDGFIDAGGVFKGNELHGIAVPGSHGLAGDLPSYGGDLFSHFGMKVFGLHIIKIFQGIAVEIKGMGREDKSQGLGFMF